ncbi:MAG: diphthamide synthesis protein [Candidatus Woesearchaeota archaeon]
MFDPQMQEVIDQINERQAKQVLVQLPDGMKQFANQIVDVLEAQTNAQVFIWFSSCFGQCDYPLGLGPLGIDLMVSYGHNRYHKTPEDW